MARRHLVVFVPGIGGSVLQGPDESRRWDAGFGSLLELARHPDRFSLADAPGLRPAGLIRSRQLLPGWTVIPGYDGLIAQLGRMSGAVVDIGDPDRPVLDANVVMFPYDFRRSVADAAAKLHTLVEARLRHLGGESQQRVVVVAHSMGGLVARCWLGQLGGWRQCRALITLGTPHRGAPKALKILVNGFLGGRLPAITDLLREWPGVAQLLPRYPAVWDVDAAAARYPHELPVPWLQDAARRATTVHDDLAAGWQDVPAGRVHVAPRIGWSHRTPSAAYWRHGALTVTKDSPDWIPLDGWGDDRGDGTVPAFSAVPTDLDGHVPDGWRVQQRHGPLGGAAWITSLLDQYERYSILTPLHGDQHPAALGLDLDEAHGQGDPIPLRVTVDGDGVQPTGATVWAVLRPAGRSTILQEHRLTPDGFGYTGGFTPPEPGLYDVTVSAADVPGGGDLTATDSIAVVDE